MKLKKGKGKTSIADLIDITEKKLTNRKVKVNKQIISIQKKEKILKGMNDVCSALLQLLLLLIAITISTYLVVGIFASPLYSYHAFKYGLFSGEVITLIAVNMLPCIIGSCFCWYNRKEILKSCTTDVVEFFDEIFQGEKKVFDQFYEKKYDRLYNEQDLLTCQLAELEWFKNNYQYLLKSEIQNKPLNKIKLWRVNKMLQQESLINVFCMLYQNGLKELKNMDETEKESLKRNIVYKAEVVKKEAALVQKNITARIQNGERLRRVERYNVDDVALGNVEKKVRKLSINR